MAIKITWKPVLQALALKDYHPDYGDEKIMVCVNPQPEFFQQRSRLVDQYVSFRRDVNRLARKASQASGPEQEELETAASTKLAEFTHWHTHVFQPGLNAWFAQLWSFGDDTYTLEDVNQFDEIDPHFLNWLKVCSIDMIDEHASARKKA